MQHRLEDVRPRLLDRLAELLEHPLQLLQRRQLRTRLVQRADQPLHARYLGFERRSVALRLR